MNSYPQSPGHLHVAVLNQAQELNFIYICRVHIRCFALGMRVDVLSAILPYLTPCSTQVGKSKNTVCSGVMSVAIIKPKNVIFQRTVAFFHSVNIWSLFYVIIIGCHFLSARILAQSCQPTSHARSGVEGEMTNDSC